MNKILAVTTGNGRLDEGDFVTYKGDEEVQVYSFVDSETINAFYPSEDGKLIEIPISELSFKISK